MIKVGETYEKYTGTPYSAINFRVPILIFEREGIKRVVYCTFIGDKYCGRGECEVATFTKRFGKSSKNIERWLDKLKTSTIVMV